MSSSLGYVALLGALAVFTVIGLAKRNSGDDKGVTADRDTYLSARASQPWLPLGISMFASGIGVWILFTPPEVGWFGGILDILGYAFGASAPFAALAWLAPRIRARVPHGITLTDWIQFRFGRPFQIYVSVVSAFYMFMFLSAELTAIGAVVGSSAFGGLSPTLGILATAAVTATYTSVGGLPASLRTDRWQGWLTIGLLSIVATSLLIQVDEPLAAAEAGGLTTTTRSGLEAIFVLGVAICAANLLHQGYWQRMWSAAEPSTIGRASLLATGLTFPVVLLVGFVGLVAAGSDTPPPFEGGVPLFDLLATVPGPIRFTTLVLAVALVASSVDTLQTGLTAVLVQDALGGTTPLRVARITTIALTVPAVAIAIQGYDILRLFLIADLVAAATVLPVLLGLSRSVNSLGAITGSVAGLVAVFLYGFATRGNLGGGWDYLTLAEAPPLPFGAFFWAPVTSATLTVVVSRLRRRPLPQRGETDLSAAD